MDELEDARAAVEAHRDGLRRVEDELRTALEEEERLQPRGLLALFRPPPDPARMEELGAVIEVLKEELKIRRQTFNEALKAAEEQESNIARGAQLPAMVVDLETAVIAVQSLKSLERLFPKLQNIAARAESARDAVPLTRSGGRHGGRRPDPHAAAKKMTAVVQHTDGWEDGVDQAELLADIVGIPLMLPRRWEAGPRPDHSPQPAADVALARGAAVARTLEEFGLAMSFVRVELDGLQRRIWAILETVMERHPDAQGTAASQPFDPMQVVARTPPPTAPGADSWAELDTAWQALRSTQVSLAALAARGARTVDYLDVMARWQRLAQEAGRLPLVREHQLVPPVNEGDLQGFVARLLAEWPALDARFEHVRAQQDL